ncbi:MAG: NAD(P)H-dependent oxidoreductase subunit E [Planctomycetaceae bacterium]
MRHRRRDHRDEYTLRPRDIEHMATLSPDIVEQIRAQFPKYPDKRAVTLPALHIVHEALRCVPTEAVREIAALLELHPAEVYDTMTFYGIFRDEDRPIGKKRLWICRSISCALRGGEDVLTEVCERLGVHPGQTTADGETTIEYAECLGACEGAPCILLNEDCHTNVTADQVVELAQK